MLTFKHFNIADWFSFYRIATAPILILFIISDLRELFSWFLLISYSTDAIDGFLARRLKITSARGSQLDSFGDQITFIIGLCGLFIFEQPFIIEHLVIILLAFVPYIAQMLLAYAKYGKSTAFHTYLAKLSAVVQSVFILFSLFFEPNSILFYSMIAFGLIETFEEITLIIMHDKWVSDVKGLYWVILKRHKEHNKNTT
ncbi:MAG: CDP-alcohol phosphatidyltransferase family protein [Winogradskyella sp.]|nr:CDP-alcohol phosphatidyltransferase family protein [Winogradskyella sp.]NNK39196.1 CDP-alcohol phosphatidyltransferase family protein [Winogradskyella sp.]